MRRAGILMPIFSLPSPHGVGTMGAAAREFVDFLEQAGQSCWQILPVGPTGYGDSPYQSYSSFAGNPYFIDLDELAAEGRLKQEEYQGLDWGDDPRAVDYGKLEQNRFGVLRLACKRLLEEGREDYKTFCRQEKDWLEDYALFMALKGKNKGAAWVEWPEGERLRRPRTLAAARKELAEELDFWRGVQYLFFRQWGALKKYANDKGISIIGDVPIYVSGDGADVWSDPTQFQLDKAGRPTAVAGCPPDDFAEDGQLWGNPLVDWEKMEADGYKWWLRRIAFQFRICDTLRIDHFRGFEAYFSIPYGEKTAKNGSWRPGPGLKFFEAVKRELGEKDIIAEDLGFLTQGVYDLLAATGYPGMKVLEFAFDDIGGNNGYLPHNYPKNCVVYTGTHDNDTLRGFIESAPVYRLDFARRYLAPQDGETLFDAFLRAAWSSVARLAIIPMQDVLNLPTAARMNTPSTVNDRNWRWRMPEDVITQELSDKLLTLNKAHSRT